MNDIACTSHAVDCDFKPPIHVKSFKSICNEYTGDVDDNNRPDGHGKLSMLSGLVYDGNFTHGLIHGKGLLQWPNGLVYDGEIDHTKLAGKGRFTWPEDCVYEGEILHGTRHGTGCMKIRTAMGYCTYSGSWQQGRRSGEGCMSYDDDQTKIYVGHWQNGRRHGFGLMRYNDHSIYIGAWKDDVKEGHGGMCWLAQPAAYVGDWSNDRPHGKGTMTWWGWNSTVHQHKAHLATNEYQGEFRLGKRHGFGVFRYADGSMYVGDWKNDEKSGLGIFTDAYGMVSLRDFTNSQKGISSMSSNSGSAFAGIHIEDLLPDKVSSFAEYRHVAKGLHHVLAGWNTVLRALYCLYVEQHTSQEPTSTTSPKNQLKDQFVTQTCIKQFNDVLCAAASSPNAHLFEFKRWGSPSASASHFDTQTLINFLDDARCLSDCLSPSDVRDVVNLMRCRRAVVYTRAITEAVEYTGNNLDGTNSTGNISTRKRGSISVSYGQPGKHEFDAFTFKNPETNTLKPPDSHVSNGNSHTFCSQQAFTVCMHSLGRQILFREFVEVLVRVAAILHERKRDVSSNTKTQAMEHSLQLEMSSEWTLGPPSNKTIISPSKHHRKSMYTGLAGIVDRFLTYHVQSLAEYMLKSPANNASKTAHAPKAVSNHRIFLRYPQLANSMNLPSQLQERSVYLFQALASPDNRIPLMAGSQADNDVSFAVLSLREQSRVSDVSVTFRALFSALQQADMLDNKLGINELTVFAGCALYGESHVIASLEHDAESTDLQWLVQFLKDRVCADTCTEIEPGMPYLRFPASIGFETRFKFSEFFELMLWFTLAFDSLCAQRRDDRSKLDIEELRVSQLRSQASEAKKRSIEDADTFLQGCYQPSRELTLESNKKTKSKTSSGKKGTQKSNSKAVAPPENCDSAFIIHPDSLPHDFTRTKCSPAIDRYSCSETIEDVLLGLIEMVANKIDA